MGHCKQLRQWYARACQRWRQVDWPLQAYAAHVGSERPRFPVDLYLGGAAGDRLGSAWQTLEAELGPDVQRVLLRQATADFAVEDLWAETLTRMMEADPASPPLADGRHRARIHRYRGLVKLVNYLITIARRLAIQRSRRLTVQGPLLSVEEVPLADVRAATPDQLHHEHQMARRLETALTTAFGQLSAERRFLLVMVYAQGMSQKQAGAMLGWSESKSSRQLAAAIDWLRQTVVRQAGVEWTPALSAVWGAVWQSCWEGGEQTPATPPAAMAEGART